MNKIEALKATLVKLKDESVPYAWGDPAMCNCGLLVQSIMNIDSKTLCDRLEIEVVKKQSVCIYSMNFDPKYLCPDTGIHMSRVIQSLLSTGFSKDDIQELEHLNNKEVLNRLGRTEHDDYDDRENVIAYITAWIEILEEETPTVEKVYVTVQVDSVVKELVSKESLHTESIMN